METRSSINYETLQESLDAGARGNNMQYETPAALAVELAGRLKVLRPANIFDPQCASGTLLDSVGGYPTKYGVEIDNAKQPGGVKLITGNCMKVFEIIDDIMPDAMFACAVANPHFGIRWKKADGSYVDSTKATWEFLTAHAACGYFIANANTIEKLGIHQDGKAIEVTFYERRPASWYWKGLRAELEIGVIVWHRKYNIRLTYWNDLENIWKRVENILKEEQLSRPNFNIYLDQRGYLKTYLSQRGIYKYKFSDQQITRLHQINGCHPLTLTTERETRLLMAELVNCGLYTIQPAAKDAIEAALREVNSIACPIMPVSDFERVAYADQEDELEAKEDIHFALENGRYLQFTKGRRYPLTTGSYKFVENFTREKVHFDEQTQQTYTATHNCQLSGNDRFIRIEDDNGNRFRFMDRPVKDEPWDIPESKLWDFFHQPKVVTVAEAFPAKVETNVAVLNACATLVGYRYFGGQVDYLSRTSVKDCALVAGETGVGKSLMAISLIAIKSPERALIIAPQGTMRASKIDDEEDDEEVEASMSASQWVKELHKFAPYLQIFEIFSYADYQQILNLNNGKLPYGVYLTYYESFFSNGGMETAPSTWDDTKLVQYMATKFGFEKPDDMPIDITPNARRHWCDTVGHEVEGVRCVIAPCLATLIGHEFDMVLADEGHKVKSLTANLTQMLIRLQPKYRYILTATPITNVVTDIFTIMGWLAVPDWYKGRRRNAAWPYSREELGRFSTTFQTQERDFTEEDRRKEANPKYRGKVINNSPIISSPARLLKLLKSILAFISKADCNADYIKPKVIDVRVPMGVQQAALYGHFTDRGNIPCGNPMVRARKQTSYLRYICADPSGFSHHTNRSPRVRSNMNPKVIAILELIREILGRGEQVVIINSRIGLSNTLVSKLAECGIPIARIDSTMPAEQHAYQANLFKSGKARVMIMGLKSAAAYSFDDADNLIVGSLEYSWGTWAQAVGRIDRITNKRVKNIYCVLHKNSIEEIMFDVVATKGDAANLCLRGRRIPRDFRPVDPAEIMAKAINQFSLTGAKPETECDDEWPKLREAIITSFKSLQNRKHV